jgi:hypothetical protein
MADCCWPGKFIGVESVTIAKFPSEGVWCLFPDVLARVRQTLQFFDRVSAEVRLNANEGLIVVHPQTKDLPGKQVLVKLVMQDSHL